jgi:hypothetical protein
MQDFPDIVSRAWADLLARPRGPVDRMARRRNANRTTQQAAPKHEPPARTT